MKKVLTTLLLSAIFAGIQAETFTNSQGVALEGEIKKADLAAGTVTIFVTAHGKDFDIPLASLAADSQAKVNKWYEDSLPKAAEWVQPGANHNLVFAELGNCNHDESPLNCNVYIPNNYALDKPVPLLVWLTGGKGGNAYQQATSVAGTDDFVCISMPYPSYEGRDIFDRQRDGGLVEFWEVHKAMLAAVEEAIPNIDPRVRVIAGFSNGAHSIGGYLTQVEEEFAEKFNVFIFGDGGVHSADWSAKHFRDAHAYSCWGQISENADMGQATADACESARMKVTRSEMVDTGHKFTPEEKEKVKKWLLETVIPDRHAAETEDALGAG